MKKRILVLLGLLVYTSLAHAWWNNDWQYRKQLKIDVTDLPQKTAAGKTMTIPVLIRLHLGNFDYFTDTQPHGEDLRFLAADDKTPLKYQIEEYDVSRQMAMIWVDLPVNGSAVAAGNLKEQTVWMYYGNAKAAPGGTKDGIFGVHHALSIHFDGASSPADATGYRTPLNASGVAMGKPGIIGPAGGFDGSASIAVAASPNLAVSANDGWVFSSWLKVDDPQSNATLLDNSDGSNDLHVSIDGMKLSASLKSGSGALVTDPVDLTPKSWHQVVVIADAKGLTLWLDGKPAATAPGTVPSFGGAVTIGAGGGGSGLKGLLDEVDIWNHNPGKVWLQKEYDSQSMESKMVVYGQDEQAGSNSGPNYFATIFQNVTSDGWVVITCLAVMAMFTFSVIIAKFFLVSRVKTGDKRFRRYYREIDPSDPAGLDHRLEKDGSVRRLRHSSLYRLYHVTIHELEGRLGKSVGAAALELTPQAIAAIRASLDSEMVQTQQKLNARMVLMTIAISGGPFLGLLGTVMGVMITFAAIAVSGDVNIASIAPGVSAALAATVAGLVVAIPSLFAYNFLSTRIRDISVDMRVFADELVARIAEYHAS